MLFAAAASALAFAAMPAAAADWYAQVNAGYSVSSQADASLSFVPDDDEEEGMSASGELDLDNGFVVGAAAGVSVGNGLRVEGEAILTNNDMDGIEELGVESIDASSAAAFVNVLYDFNMGAVTPYVGAGVGFGSTSLEVDGDSVHDEGMAWQVKAGVSYPVNDTLTLDVGYRYMNMASWEQSIGDADIDDDPDAGPGTIGVEIEPTSHILTVGARFKLGAGPAQ
jgi:opacity protein-like surface antigen